jgi:hypothetical protein
VPVVDTTEDEPSDVGAGGVPNKERDVGMRRRLDFALIAALWCGLVGCGPSAPVETDAGTPAAFSTPELDPLAAYTETPDAFVPATLDYSCLGSRTRPVGGDPVDVTFQLRDFQDGVPVKETDVWLFTDDVIADQCAAPDCTMFTTDASGNAMVTMPAGGWYAYRVLPKMGLTSSSTVFAVFQYNEPAPAAGGMAVTGNSVSGVTIDLVPRTLGVERVPGRAILAGRIADCNDAFVENAIVRVYDADGEPMLPGELNDQPHYNYFAGIPMNEGSNLPNLLQAASNVDGLYTVIQVPVNDDGRPYRVEAWGELDGELTLLACEEARIFGDAVTILNLDPRRSDAPASCPTN